MNNTEFELLKAIVRLIGVTFFLNAAMELSHLPEEFIYLSQKGFIAQTAVAATTTMAFRAGINIVLGIVFCCFSSSVAKLAGKALHVTQPNPSHIRSPV